MKKMETTPLVSIELIVSNCHTTSKAFPSLPFIFIIGFCVMAGFLFCLSVSSFSEELRIIAHYKEKLKERIIATGNVEVHYKNIKVFADRIELNTETKEVYAEGNVSIHLPEEVANCEKIRFNLDSSEGELKKVFGMIQPTIIYEAETVKRKNAGDYSFQKASITSCTQAIPRWKFSCSKANYKKNEYMEMWNSVLSIRKIPLFYFPYLRYPLNRERATGFLMPQLGYSGTKGLFYSQSFYWALKRNMDATFNLDYFSTRGLGGGLEYRYLFSAGTGGNLKLYYFNYKQDPEQVSPVNAYLFRFAHNQPLPFNFTLVANVDYQSSFNFLREFDNDFKRAVVFNRSSQVYLSRAWSYFNFNARFLRFETYFKEIDDSIIRYNLPEVNFSSSLIKIISPLYFRFVSSFSRWESGWGSQFRWNGQTRSENLTLKPVLSIPFTSIPWFTLNSSFSADFSYHFQSYAPNSREVIDEPLLTQKYALHMELIGPVFSRIFFGANGTPKLKHIIEPAFTYRYETPITSSERIIVAYPFYRFHKFAYSLTNRFLIKEHGMPREAFNLGLAQTFYIAPEDSPLSTIRYKGKIPQFSNVNGYIRFYPSRSNSLDFSVSFNPYYKTFSALRLGADLGSFEGPAFFNVHWYKSINPYYRDPLSDRHQISFFGGVRIPKLSMRARAAFDYNIQERKMLYTAFVLIYHYQCFDFKAVSKIFYFREKPEMQFRISFGLGNIGKTTDFLGGFGF